MILALVTIACKNDKKKSDEQIEEIIVEEEMVVPKIETLTISLEAKSDSNVSGSITFTQENNTVSMVANMEGLTEGTHAIHIHQTSDCSAADGTSAGGHWNPTNQPHGEWGAESGYHKGDIGNFSADADGKATVTFSTSEWCISCGDDTKDIMGKGIIVHAGTDDFTSQPSGAAGARVSCAGIIE